MDNLRGIFGVGRCVCERPDAAKTVAEKAGLELAYRDLLGGKP